VIELERSGAARNGLPGFRPYVYKGTGEDIYHGAAGYLDDVRRRAVTRHEESMPDTGPGPEWYRELAEETGASPDPAPAASVSPAPVPAPAPPRAPSAWLALDGDELAELAAARERNQAALTAVPAPGPLPAPPAVTPASRRRRCRRCGYLTTAAGHRVMCDE
jgi:hypothetical protein